MTIEYDDDGHAAGCTGTHCGNTADARIFCYLPSGELVAMRGVV